jgi:hypothetical protein
MGLSSQKPVSMAEILGIASYPDDLGSASSDAGVPLLYAPSRPRSVDSQVLAGWDPAIASLHRAGHSFLPCAFSEDGYLYRAIATDARARIAQGSVGFSEFVPGQLETTYQISFVTHQLSDAITVIRDGRTTSDWCIGVLPAQSFNAAWANGRAAFLAFAEAGHVFRYPIMVGALSISEFAKVLTSQDVGIADLESLCTRYGWNNEARVIQTTRYPGGSCF